jgi:hypothetical protein
MINIRNNICNLIKKDSIGCELGVFEGDFSSVLLASNKFKQLYLVDVFTGKASNFNKSYEDASVLESMVRNKFSNSPEVVVIKQESVSFLQSMPDLFFDFIYIDTVHSYEHTIKELNESYRVIKKNGLICGHDYCPMFNGVIEAVKDFIQTKGLVLTVTTEHDFPSFIISQSYENIINNAL